MNFATTATGFTQLFGPGGINNANFISAARIVCGSSLVGEAAGVAVVTLNKANTPGWLASGSGTCRATVLTVA